MSKLLKSLPKFITLVLLASLTLFLTLNGLEVLSNWNTSYTGAVEKMQNSAVIDSIVAQSRDKELIYPSDFKNIVNIDFVPDQISFDSINTEVFLSPSRQTQDGWFTRTYNAHFVPLNQDLRNHDKDYLIYTRNHWRAISNVDKLKKNDTLELIAKDGTRAIFGITSISRQTQGDDYVLGRNPKKQLLIMVEDIQNNSYWSIEAELKNRNPN